MAKKEAETETEEQENEEVVAKKGLSTVKIIIIVVTLTLLLGGGLIGGTFYFISSMNDSQASAPKKEASDVAENEDDEEEEEDEDADEEDAEAEITGPPVYHSMDPKFVVSFSNQKFARFMQFSLEIMSRDPEAIVKVETHIPVIRSSLLMLFGSQSYEVMVTREGKEKLLMDVKEDVNATLQKVTGNSSSSSIEAAYFTSFVIQ